MTQGIVHIVHHVDTEGPLSEPLSELFERIEQVTGTALNLAPTKSNLALMQSSDFVLKDAETTNLLKRLVDPALMTFKTSWYEVDEMLDRILTDEFRNRFTDDFGNGWVYNWHLLDHVGFETNPRRRDMGYGSIFRFYLDKLKALNCHQDSTQWHFHPIPFDKAANNSAGSYMNSAYELQQVMCRRLIDYNWFPTVNRAGFHTVRPDSNWWLEQWLPFDASNQSSTEDNTAFTDNINGRFGDWRGAPDDWSIYSPDWYDWRKPGTMKRSIARCLNMNTRFRNISADELRKAFIKANLTQQPVYVGITNHDFREMSTEIVQFWTLLDEVKKEFPGVKTKNSTALFIKHLKPTTKVNFLQTKAFLIEKQKDISLQILLLM